MRKSKRRDVRIITFCKTDRDTCKDNESSSHLKKPSDYDKDNNSDDDNDNDNTQK